MRARFELGQGLELPPRPGMYYPVRSRHIAIQGAEIGVQPLILSFWRMVAARAG